MSSLRRALNSHWLSNQNISGSKIVDLGSGSIPAKKWVHNMTFDTYVTVDIQEKFNPDVVMDMEKPIDEYGYEKVKPVLNANCVLALELLEHTINPMQVVKNIYKMLKIGGFAYITVPFINPIHDDWDYIRLTHEGLKKLIKDSGLKIVEFETTRATNGYKALLEFFTNEGLRMSRTRLDKGESESMLDIGYCVKVKK